MVGPVGSSRPALSSRRPRQTEVADFARRMARVETTFRLLYLGAGLLLCIGGVALSIYLLRMRAIFGLLVGGGVLTVAGVALLQRALTGRDVDLRDLSTLNTRLRRWW
jgi:hypothetical protein